ncbi:MAG TPA: cold shock domain-containing protein [Pirellulales bacterium]|jgi:CspA family cold shock protein|nr:cold shock domain-containing protein [Pirellulales bacterium]
MPLGFIKRLVSEKHFGFITPGADEPDVYFHASAVEADGFDRLRPGQPVEYDLDDDPERRGQGLRARAVRRCRSDQIVPAGPLAPLRRHPRARRRKPSWRGDGKQ